MGPRILSSLLRVTLWGVVHQTFGGARPRCLRTWVRVLALLPKVHPDPEMAPNFQSRPPFSELTWSLALSGSHAPLRRQGLLLRAAHKHTCRVLCLHCGHVLLLLEHSGIVVHF